MSKQICDNFLKTKIKEMQVEGIKKFLFCLKCDFKEMRLQRQVIFPCAKSRINFLNLLIRIFLTLTKSKI